MNRDLLLSSNPGEIRAALVENGSIVELRVARSAKPTLLGAIFLARVTRVVRALPGVFLDLGGLGSAFLQAECRADAELPTEGTRLVVQIIKEAHGGKPPEVTTALSIQAAHLVWTPMRPGIAVSRQIAPTERARLSQLLKEIICDGEGAVVRTSGTGASKEILMADAASARQSYATLLERAKSSKPPARLDTAESPARSVVLGFADRALDRIVVDDPYLVNDLRYLGPEIVLDKTANQFTDSGFEEAFETVLLRSIDVAGHAKIVIDSAEACTLIDVNLGSSVRGEASAAIFEANRAAALEIAHQLRLRNIGGSIVIDFISMRSRAHRDLVEAVFKEAASNDPAAIELHGWTSLGHLELTRQRRSPSMAETLLKPAGEPQKSLHTVSYAVLRAITRAPLPPGAIEILLNPGIATLLEGELAPWFQEAVRCCGHTVRLKPEAGRAVETFDIGPASSSTNHDD